MKDFMKKHSNLIRNCSYWAIFLLASLAVSVSIADVAAKNTMEILILHPELAQNSMLVKVGYLPTF